MSPTFTPEAVGDYLAGPNHTLPTAGCARFESALGVYDFERNRVRIQRQAAFAVIEHPVSSADDAGLESRARATLEAIERIAIRD